MLDTFKLLVWVRQDDAVLLADNLRELERIRRLGSFKAPCLFTVLTADREYTARSLVQHVTYTQAEDGKLVATTTEFELELSGNRDPVTVPESEVRRITAHW